MPVCCSDCIPKSVLHTDANVFIGVLAIVDCRERNESWLLKVMIAYTVWILLFVIWIIVFSVHKHAMMGRSKTGDWLIIITQEIQQEILRGTNVYPLLFSVAGSSRQNEIWSQQREKVRVCPWHDNHTECTITKSCITIKMHFCCCEFQRTLGTAAKIATAVSVILIVGTMSFTAAVIGGIFSGKQS